LDSNELFFFSSFSLSSLWISRYHFRNQMCYVTLYLHQFWSLFFLLIFFILIFFKVGLFFNFVTQCFISFNCFYSIWSSFFWLLFFIFFLILFSISSVNILFHLSFFFLSIFSPYSFYFLISCLIILFHLICISNLIFILLIALFNFRWLRILLCDFLIIAFNGIILASLS
jgi:hypothetical protein